jgi:hypothetical protein
MTNSDYKLVFVTMINPFYKPFVDDFHLETDLVLHRKTFIFAFTCFPCLSSGGPSDMVYELLSNCFVPNDSASDFDLFKKNMRAHHSWSCSSISIMLSCIATIAFEKINCMH